MLHPALTWARLHALLLQVGEELQEEIEGIVCSDALELELLHIGLWGWTG